MANRPCALPALLLLATLHPAGLAQEAETSTERQKDTLGPHSLTLPAPIKRWDNALPLGNGLIGGLLWGEERELRLSLDRGDLWDERGNPDVYDPKRNYKTLLESIESQDRGLWTKYFDATYTGSKWTKIPGGRLVITLPKGAEAEGFELDFERATAEVQLTGDQRASVFFSATEPVAVLRVPGGSSFQFVRPESIDSLGYPAPDVVYGDDSISYSQGTAQGLRFNFTIRWKSMGEETLVVLATATSEEHKDPASAAAEAAAAAIVKGWDALHRPHLAWWQSLYRASTVTIPEPRLQHHYNLVKYFYGAASRAHASPMPLQGVWTADSGGLPPWKGDYHNDLNTQMTYVAWQTAGLTDPGMSYINYYVNRMPQFRQYGKDFFGLETAMVPGVMTHRGQAMGGWPQYAMSLTAGLWNGHAFYRHWKTTGDDAFLASTAYPWLGEIATSVLALTDEKDGKLYLRTSSSPEWNDASWSAYLTPNSNFDQALLTWSIGALQEMASTLGKADEAAEWSEVMGKMSSLQYSEETKALLISDGIEFEDSHRHFSHALAIHPLGLLDIDQSSDAREAVRATVRQLLDQGSRAWVGYSFTWGAALAARADFPEDAARLLTDFERAFVSRNGFHVNGDQTGTGLSGFTYRPFTLEGNFLFMDAVHEMLLRSHGKSLQIFPAVPESWRDCAFTDLRAEGGFKVSATRLNGKTEAVSVTALRDAQLVMQHPFEEGIITEHLKAGETLRLSR